MASITDRVGDLGGYLREQRKLARLSVRQLASLAGVSNPYLSQVERGLRNPSAEVLSQIAKGLAISAEVLYVRAGILDSHDRPDVESAISADPSLTDRQRRVLLDIYATFRSENLRAEPEPVAEVIEPEAVRGPRKAPSSRARTTAPKSPSQRRRTVMAVITELRKSLSEYPPVLAVVGATDLAVEQVRKAAADPSALQAEVTSRVTKAANEVEKAVSGIDSASVQAFVSKNLDRKVLADAARQAPALVVARALEVAGELEVGYEHLAARGKALVHRIESQRPTQDLVTQGRATLSRTRAAVTTGRKAVASTRREVESEVDAEVASVRTAVKRTAGTARRGAASTRTATKGAATSARKTASRAVKAAESAAEKVGD